jgi:hypothetical protein
MRFTFEDLSASVATHVRRLNDVLGREMPRLTARSRPEELRNSPTLGAMVRPEQE